MHNRSRVGAWLARSVAGGGLAVALAALAASPAHAHALVVKSTPAAGASLAQVPSAVTITFSEAPAPGQSSIDVFDASGARVSRGASHVVGSDRLTFSVPLAPLLNGVYTVRWRTVSADDGHSSSGTFTFGVGPSAYAASAGPAPGLAAPPSAASPLVVAGHWLLYAGIGLLVGGAWVTLFALPGAGRRPVLLALAGAGLTLAGLAISGIAQAAADDIPVAQLPQTSLGLGLFAQAVPTLAAAACLEAALLARRLRPALLAVALLLAAGAIGAHVLTTHAAAGRLAWLMVGVEWAHLAAFAAWIGGLAALLAAIGTTPSPARARAVRRFSTVAGIALAVVAAAGAALAVDEVAAWSAVATTLFGQLVLAKVALLGVMALLGLLNRRRFVPAAERSLRGLRRVARAEIGVAGLVLVASAMLTSLVPPAIARVAVRQPPPPVVTARAAQAVAGLAVKADVAVTPGYVGQNRFTVHVYDAATNRVLDGPVALRFRMPARPDLAETTLSLERQVDGSYSAAGDNLAFVGAWVITAVVTRGADVAEVPFQVPCGANPQVGGATMGGTPMAHGLKLANGWQLEAFLYPGRAGRNTLHLVFTDQRSGPVSVPAIPAVTTSQGSVSRALSVGRLAGGTSSPNNFEAVGTFTSGQWQFQVTAQGDGGARLATSFALTVQK